ncbi:MAG: hypothetical protein HWN66_09195 [Candidatus Helarchaeota archaeon]|nr:hypothetical protein [Candidatus Helarchaeota archaeon]
MDKNIEKRKNGIEFKGAKFLKEKPFYRIPVDYIYTIENFNTQNPAHKVAVAFLLGETNSETQHIRFMYWFIKLPEKWMYGQRSLMLRLADLPDLLQKIKEKKWL